MDNDACAALFEAYWPHQQLHWATPDEFLRQAETPLPKTDIGAVQTLLWLYLPPWMLQTSAYRGGDSEAVGLGLARWYQQQRAALALRRTLGERMLLVNAERVTGMQLAAQLGLPKSQEHSLNGQLAPQAERPFSDAMGLGLAKLFEWSLPQYWDLFEDLEASAWLPRGDPLFRRDLEPVSVAGLEALLAHLQQGLRAPQLRSSLDQSTALATSLRDRLQETETALKREQEALAELRQQLKSRVAELEEQLEQRESARAAMAAERDSLQTALADEHGRLLERERELAELHGALAQAKQEAAEAQREAIEAERKATDAQAALAAQEAAQQAENAEAAARAQALTEDKQRLQAELHEIRDAHEGQLAANRELRARLARSTETLDRARVQLCRQLARAGLGVS
ncbi:MAG: hypothetical protein C1943_10405 [Halochromatium sp.]|nr:hypothetical protein [Halochromatium sp.]